MVMDCGTREDNTIWLNKDCCGLTCASFTYFLLLFAGKAFRYEHWSGRKAFIGYVVVKIVIYPWMGNSIYGMFHITLFLTFVVLAIASHLKVSDLHLRYMRHACLTYA